jgi:hypothetical protein
VTFESVRCVQCDSELAFAWEDREIVALGKRPRCAGHRLTGCNGRAGGDEPWCESCALTRTRPAEDDRAGLGGFARAEAAKRRLLFELHELALPVTSWRERNTRSPGGLQGTGGGLAFDLLSSTGEPVMTGHADGVITLDLGEADDAQREQRRQQLGEPYRTVLGHLRHEVAHYYQDILVPEGSAARDECREIFGDDRDDYAAAIDRHYEQGPAPDWQASFVSAYATMHPWEDWAETFAHYLHIRDALQTAEAYGVRVEGPQVATTDRVALHSDPGTADSGLDELLAAWLPLTYALNAINRSMGAADVYPFVLVPEVQRKLAFVDRCVRAAASA